MKNIIWLTEWLPTSIEPYGGDGIERRAKAVSLYNNIYIIYVKKRPGIGMNRVQIEERIYNEHCRAMIYYYPSIRKWSRLLDLFLSNYYFLRLHYKALREYKRKYGTPAGVQVNVTMKDGIIALLYKWIAGINYIVVEGWSLFLPESKPCFKDKNRLFRFLTQQVLKHSKLLVTVSDHLGKMINRNVTAIRYQTIPSVVDTSIFFPSGRKTYDPVFRFIHISSLDHPKNFEQVLEAVKIVIDRGHKIQLVVHGPDRASIHQLTQKLVIEKAVIFRSEVPQHKLAEALHQADALVLYSRYETFGNVLIEANACGLPVIVSDYPTFHEIVVEGKTGITATGNNPQILADKMIYVKEHFASFNNLEIAAYTANTYRFEVIAKLFDDVYNKLF